MYNNNLLRAVTLRSAVFFVLLSASHVDDDVRCTCVVVCCQCVLSATTVTPLVERISSCIVYHCMPEKLYMYFYIYSYLLCAAACALCELCRVVSRKE